MALGFNSLCKAHVHVCAGVHKPERARAHVHTCVHFQTQLLSIHSTASPGAWLPCGIDVMQIKRLDGAPRSPGRERLLWKASWGGGSWVIVPPLILIPSPFLSLRLQVLGWDGVTSLSLIPWSQGARVLPRVP